MANGMVAVSFRARYYDFINFEHTVAELDTQNATSAVTPRICGRPSDLLAIPCLRL